MLKGKATMLAGFLVIGTTMSALHAEKVQPNKTDSIINLEEVEIVSTRAGGKTPIAYTTITAKQLQENNAGQDIPYLLSSTPSILTTSDAGMGIGYTSMRVRGTDGTRINITVNGVPMNDAESHTVYFVNMPDLASSLKDIQVQRGAGTSTNGGGAFGASVNMQTSGLQKDPEVSVDGSFGSFNTHKETVKVNSGLLKNHWSVGGRFSNIGTDGYIDRASVKLNSYMLHAGYYGDNTALRFLTFNGWEQTYHAWNYASKDEMKAFGRTYNSCGEYTDDLGNTAYYKDQIDRYNQQNYQVLLTQALKNHWDLHAALFYTHGKGYYEEYKTGRTLTQYGLTPYQDATGAWVEESDLVRRKKMSNDFGGSIVSLNYKGDRLQATLGGGLSRYVGDHYGKLVSVRDPQVAFDKEGTYYTNQGRKTDANVYAKAEYQWTDWLNLYGDMQYRFIDYKIEGSNDNWDWNTEAMQMLEVKDQFKFFNPKVGLNVQATDHHRFYASFAVAQKEPTRNNYTDGIITALPKSELLKDYEAGFEYRTQRFFAGVNGYFMDYKDQLVLTGELNNIGEAMATNMPDSYRMGVELMGKWQLTKQWTWDANTTLSKSCIQKYTETLYEDGWKNPVSTELGNMTTAFSPSVIANMGITYQTKGWRFSLHEQYVSKQYLTNSEQEDLTIDPYKVANLEVGYTFKPCFAKTATVGFTVYNLLDEEYENNGWGYSQYTKVEGVNVRQNSSGLAAQAGIHAMGHFTLNF